MGGACRIEGTGTEPRQVEIAGFWTKRAPIVREKGASMAKFLVVDDAAFMRMRCVKLLHENGFETVEAENGAQAVETYQRVRPDAVLMDITMPEMDGLEA